VPDDRSLARPRAPNIPRSMNLTSLADVYATVAELLSVSIQQETARRIVFQYAARAFRGKPLTPRPSVSLQQDCRKKCFAIRQGKWKYLAHQGSEATICHA